jgi:hypothetical protein
MDLIVVCSHAGMMSSEELKYRRWELIEVGTRDANRWLPQAITVDFVRRRCDKGF